MLKLKTVKNVTLPLLKQEDEKTIHVRIENAIFVAPKSSSGRERKADDGGTMKQPPKLVHVTNLEDGVQCQLIVNAVLESTLNDHYPDASYVGKCFSITRHKIEGGKAYAKYDVAEVEVETEETAAKPEPAKKK